MGIAYILSLSVIEGLTEFLPVSSTAHLLLTQKLFALVAGENVLTDPLFATFCIFIQAGAIGAALIYFWQSLWQNKQIWLKLLVAVVPTAIVGLGVYKLVKDYLQDASPLTGWMLIVGGIGFSLFDAWWSRRRPDDKNTDTSLQNVYVGEVEKTPWWKMSLVGLWQSVAIVPGVSRSGVTQMGARTLGFSKAGATALAFVVALPTICGATFLDIIQTVRDGEVFVEQPRCIVAPCPAMLNWSNVLLCLTGFVIALAVGWLVMKPMIKLMATKPFWYFGIYRVIVGLIWLSWWRT
ncbi:undecaprenyl-diphosphate phosphatase [bacterium]|nr:undecaprenyl-diphosphate phosphatase [bacterium]